MTQLEIAQELGISRSAVAMRLRRFGTAYITEAQAKTGPKLHAPRTGEQRRCLCCTAIFNSTGKGNRRCPACTAELGRVQPADGLWIKVCL